MSGVELATVLGALAAVLGSVAVIYKMRPERDSLIMTQTQGAATILNDLVDTLREEVQRERALRRETHDRLQAERVEHRAELKVRDEKIVALEAEAVGLRTRYGTRTTDEEGQ